MVPAQMLALIVVPPAALANDSFIRRRTLILIALGAEFAAALGSFTLTRDGSLVGHLAAKLAFNAMLSLIMGNDPAIVSEQFPGAYRMSAYSVAFNLGIGICGGTAPAIATALIAVTGFTLAPAFYLMLAATAAAGGAYLMEDCSREPLPE
jgi:MHS family proline/betaine transporter-like MFS transporter